MSESKMERNSKQHQKDSKSMSHFKGKHQKRT